MIPAQVGDVIYERAGNPNLKASTDFDKFAGSEFSRQKSNLLSIVEVESGYFDSQFLTAQKEALDKLSLISEHQYLESWKPGNASSRDSKAIYQGIGIPPHARVLAQVLSIQTTIAVSASLAEFAKQIASHTSRQRQLARPNSSRGTRVFVGHGGSQVWRELKDFLEDRLGLLVDEFNRVSSAGVATTNRLSTMTDTAGFAFLVMTGEDEQPSGTLRPRENVVHEAGLFQGRLALSVLSFSWKRVARSSATMRG